MMEEHDPGLHTIPPDRKSMSEQPAWRQDFPIDRAADTYLARRDFTKFLVLTSFAFVVGKIWIAMRNLWRRVEGTPPMLRIADLKELPVGGAVTFHYPTGDDPALLVRPEENTLIAYASQCTHLQCPVLPDLEQNRLHCPCHAGYFDLQGDVLAGPPRRPLPRIELETRGEAVYAVGIEGDLT